MMINICLLGLGRTGMVVAEQLLKATDFSLVAVVAKPNSPKSGSPLTSLVNSPTDLIIQSADDLPHILETNQIDVAIDFTAPEASLKNMKLIAEHHVNVVIGTTGFNKIQIYELKKIVQHSKIGLLYAPNISLGINLLLAVVKTIARIIPHYDVEITESHHRNKKDSPSGTAFKIADAISQAKGHHTGKYTFGRKGKQLREGQEIGIHAIRAGGIVGVHQVLFAGESDEIEITHRSYSRLVFAEGALHAAQFINNRHGFYNMEEVMDDINETTATNGPEAPAITPASLTMLAE
jgi:4-hydroxy-tetrahydrodipicolinate reductase